MKVRTILSAIALAAAGLVLWVPLAHAVGVRHVFEGNASYAFDDTGTIDFGLVDSYSGELVYDPLTPAGPFGLTDPTVGDYLGAIQEFTVTLGGSEFSLGSGFNSITVWDRESDSIDITADLIGPVAIGTIRAELELTDQDGVAFGSDALPASVAFSDFNSPRRLIMGHGDSNFYVNGTPLTRFEVPEPTTFTLRVIALASVGLAGVVLRRHRKEAV